AIDPSDRGLHPSARTRAARSAGRLGNPSQKVPQWAWAFGIAFRILCFVLVVPHLLDDDNCCLPTLVLRYMETTCCVADRLGRGNWRPGRDSPPVDSLGACNIPARSRARQCTTAAASPVKYPRHLLKAGIRLAKIIDENF